MVDLNLLQSIGTIRQFKKNEMVFLQNDVGTDMYIVLKGIFGVYINSFTDFPIRVAGIEHGSFFGEMSIIDGWPRSATIVSEDDGAALVIEKNNFGLLLEKSPEIAASILDTLRNRTLATAEAVQAAGKEAPALPPLLKTVQFRDIKSSQSFLTMLAQRVRQMNDLLTGSPDAEIRSVAREALPQKREIIRLLPDGYTPFNLKDYNDIDKLMNGTKGICPYCASAIYIFIPAFSRLVQKEVTLDQRIIYENFNILWYANTVCSNCNYTDSYQEFMGSGRAEKQPRYSGNQFENAEGFTGFATPCDHTLDEVILSYYLRIACLEKTTGDPLRFANAWIRLYWLYGDNNRMAFAKQAASKAHDYYARYSDENDRSMGTKDKMRVNTILGELCTAIGEYERAKEYYKENSVIGRMLDDDMLKQSIKRYNEIKHM